MFACVCDWCQPQYYSQCCAAGERPGELLVLLSFEIMGMAVGCCSKPVPSGKPLLRQSAGQVQVPGKVLVPNGAKLCHEGLRSKSSVAMLAFSLQCHIGVDEVKHRCVHVCCGRTE